MARFDVTWLSQPLVLGYVGTADAVLSGRTIKENSMRHLFSLLMTTVCVFLTTVSMAHADEKEDIVYGSVGMGVANFSGGDFESGIGIGHRVGLGFRVSDQTFLHFIF